jgi:hypothetical protein
MAADAWMDDARWQRPGNRITAFEGFLLYFDANGRPCTLQYASEKVREDEVSKAMRVLIARRALQNGLDGTVGV